MFEAFTFAGREIVLFPKGQQYPAPHCDWAIRIRRFGHTVLEIFHMPMWDQDEGKVGNCVYAWRLQHARSGVCFEEGWDLGI